MTLFAAIGKAQGLDAVEAAIQAADRALAKTGRHNISLAIIAASHDFPVQQVVDGVTGLLSDTPLIGFSTPAQLTAEGTNQRSIVIALLLGDQLHAESDWWSESNRDGDKSSFQSINISNRENKAMLIVADGLHGDAQKLINTIPKSSVPLAGCLSGGDMMGEKTYQIGGSGYGSEGIAAAILRGQIQLGIGTQHGWQPVGLYSRVTRSVGLHVKTLGERRSCEMYAEVFGYPARDWTYPPLNQLVRLYPLGFERNGMDQVIGSSLHIRSPLRVEPDGSLRMHSIVPQGETAHLLVSSIDSCMSAARSAAEQAVQSLGNAKPVLALIFADIAWQMQLQSQPGIEVFAVREVIGDEVPIIGGYTYGQIGKSATGDLELLNQHIQVILFGDPQD